MSAKARAEHDWMRDGVRIIVQPDKGQIIHWPTPVVHTVDEAAVEPDEDAWLRLPDGIGRAIYEALADHYGHAGHDIRALRKDYDAERGRVDQFIAHLTRGAS